MRQFLQRIRHWFWCAYQDARVHLLYARGGVRSRPPTQAERELLLTVPAIQRAGYPVHYDSSCESFSTRVFPNGSLLLKYLYEENEPESGFLRLVLVSRVEREPGPAQAEDEYHKSVDAYIDGAAKVGARFVYKGNLQRWCNNAFLGFTLGEPDESVVGCILCFQKGRMLYSIILRGIVLDREEHIEELVYPFLERAYTWCESAA